jgi:SAM-dependent methyltransferase
MTSRNVKPALPDEVTSSPQTDFKSGADTYSSAIATAHRYSDWILSPFKPYLHGNIVEVGIGHGGYYEAIRPYGSYWGVDIDVRSIKTARELHPEGNFVVADICLPGFIDDVIPQKADAIVSINVLEHIKDDKLAIRNLVDALKPGGHLMINVPAMQSLYNDLDRLAGHFRRYAATDFDRLLHELPVAVETLCYFNPIGGAGWWLNRFRRHKSLNSDLVNGQIVLFENYVLPVSRALDPLTRTFFGQSLICIARRL